MTGPFGFSDAARRMSDAINQAVVDGHQNRWMAFALEDGATNGTIYDSKEDAHRALRNSYRQHMVLRVPWDGCPPKAAEAFLRVHRQLKEIGQHPDDEMHKTMIMMDNRLEAYPSLDIARQRVVRARRSEYRRVGERRSPGGVILP